MGILLFFANMGFFVACAAFPLLLLLTPVVVLIDGILITRMQ